MLKLKTSIIQTLLLKGSKPLSEKLFKQLVKQFIIYKKYNGKNLFKIFLCLLLFLFKLVFKTNNSYKIIFLLQTKYFYSIKFLVKNKINISNINKIIMLKKQYNDKILFDYKKILFFYRWK